MENAVSLLIVTSKPVLASLLKGVLPYPSSHRTLPEIAADAAATALLLLPETAREITEYTEKASGLGLPMLMLLPEGIRAQPSCRSLARPVPLLLLQREVEYLLQQPRKLYWRGIGAFDPTTLLLSAENGKQTTLTEKEAALLSHLAGQSTPQKAEVILAALWHYHPTAESHTFDTHLYRLRQKLESVFETRLSIQLTTEGYQLVVG